MKGVSLEVPEGSFFGLLGPNGAGKSTIINIMAGLAGKTGGKVVISGHDIDKDLRRAKMSIGIVPQELVLDPFFTVREALEFHSGYYGIPKSRRRTEEIINALSLKEKAETGARRLSGGMRRRLLIGKALVHSPKVLVLDEPTAGVDIELREQLWEYVRKLNREGVTVLLTTHYLEEAEELCDRIAIINHGEIVACDSKAALLAKMDHKRLIISFAQALGTVPEPLKRFDSSVEGNRLVISYRRSETRIGEILSHLQGLNVTDIISEDAKLEDIFKSLTSVNAARN